jgi:hypothetical protein
VRHDVGIWAEVGLGDDDLIARAARNRREQLVSATNVAPLDRSPFAARVRSQTFPAASSTTLAGVAARCAASVVEKLSNRQTKGPGVKMSKVLCKRTAQSVLGGRLPGVGESLHATAPGTWGSPGFIWAMAELGAIAAKHRPRGRMRRGIIPPPQFGQSSRISNFASRSTIHCTATGWKAKASTDSAHTDFCGLMQRYSGRPEVQEKWAENKRARHVPRRWKPSPGTTDPQ